MSGALRADGLGAIFDWDGVVIDSSRQHEESWERLAREEGRALPPGHFKLGFGKKNTAIIPQILHWTDDPATVRRLSLRKEVLYREIVLERGLTALPGVQVFLARLQAAGIPCCIGSSTDRENIVTILRVLGFGTLFAGMVTAEDVAHGKPDPAVFLKAAALIDRAPSQCIVFEDALVGIEAARAGGMKAVGVATTNPSKTLAGHAHCVVHRLDELSVDDFVRLVHG